MPGPGQCVLMAARCWDVPDDCIIVLLLCRYQVPITHRGRLVSEPRYVRFPTGKAKSDLEWKILRSQKVI